MIKKIFPHMAVWVLFSWFAQPLFSQMSLPDTTFLREHYVKQEYEIPMRDSVKLFTAVYLPKDSTEQHPILLTRTPYSVAPYGTDNYPRRLSNLTKQYFDRNYIIVSQDVRGRFMSEGTYVNVRPYIADKKSHQDIDETSDTYDTIDWLIKHLPRNNGNVGVKGISYPGFYTTMATIDAHPAVKATSPQAPVSQWMSGDDFFHNGALLLPHCFDFYMRFGWPRAEPTTMDFHGFDHRTPDGYQFFLNFGPLSTANLKYMHDSVAFWTDITHHGTWDKFWVERSVLPHLQHIKPATMVVGGWFDTENLYGALHLFAQIEKDNPGHPNTLVMGPWSHGAWSANDLDSLGSIKFGSNLSEFFADQLEVPFFEHYLRGKEEPKLPKAVVFLTGANEWKMLDSWPPKNTETKHFYLNQHGELSFDPPQKPSSEYDEYVSDPKKPVPYTNEITNWYNPAFMLEDQRFAARRPDVLVYETDVLTDNITIAGPITAHLVASTSGTDCDWIVKVIDVFPDTAGGRRNNKLGGYEMLVRGDVLRGKFRKSLSAPEPIPSNEPTIFEYALQDVFHQFRRGHRVMIQVQSTWFPMIDLNPGKFEDIFTAKETDFQKITQRVYHSTQQASYVEVNLVHSTE
jgi:putative CocE/NonD family hydrolase